MDSYDAAGVRGQGEALSAVARHLGPTLGFAEGAEVLTRFGHYATAIRVSDELAIAICTDGVGSKTIVASLLDRYDTIGFDCVAMNANDLICIGARPIAMVDYLGVHTLDPKRTEEILKGLGDAAKEAGISIPGGEMAQLPEVIGSDGVVEGDEKAFDLVGTCIGLLHPDRLILGDRIEPGDALIALHASGLHSNGFTLARRVLLGDAGMKLDEHVEELGRTLGEELLIPTEIYVRAARALWDAGVDTRGLAHITGDGLTNLCRLEAPVGYELETLPVRPAIFDLIQSRGSINIEEMYRVFNMGIGLAVVVPAEQADSALEAITSCGYAAERVGEATDETGIVRIRPEGLVGGLREGDSYFERA